MTSPSYQIQWDSVGVGGEDTSESASYRLRDSLQMLQGTSTSSSYQVGAGYRAGIYDPVVHFTVHAQDRSTQVAATDITATSVTVTSTSDFAVNDYIGVVANEGLSQASAIGRITSVAGNDLNVDFFTYQSTLPVIDSQNDYVYKLEGSNIPLANLSPNIAVTGLVAWDVDADVPTGYTVYVADDHDLRMPSDSGELISDVADGVVTLGAEEYGGRSSDATLNSSFDSADGAFTETFQEVASRTTPVLHSRDFLTLKAAVNEATLNGSYAHTLTVVFVGNY